MVVIVSCFSVLVFALLHIFIGRCRFLDSPDTPWHSFAGGVAVSYVFVYTLPKLAKKQVVLLASKDSGLYGFLEHHAYLVALSGFIVYYAVDRAVMHRKQMPAEQADDSKLRFIGFINLLLYAAYLTLIGYYLAEFPDFTILVLAVAVMLLHLLSVAHDIRHRNEILYDTYVRWFMAASLIVGWLIGELARVPEETEALWFAFLAGAILIHAIEGELPAKKHHRLGPFLLGTVLFTAVVVFIGWYSNQP